MELKIDSKFTLQTLSLWANNCEKDTSANAKSTLVNWFSTLQENQRNNVHLSKALKGRYDSVQVRMV